MIIRSLSDTKTFRIPGIESVEFILKTLDSKTYKRLFSNLGRCKGIVNALDAGLTIEEYRKLKATNPQKYEQAEDDLHDAFADFVRYGVAGHKGIESAPGVEIPFELEGDIVSKKIIDIYDLQRWIIPLGLAVQNFNGVSEGERKN